MKLLTDSQILKKYRKIEPYNDEGQVVGVAKEIIIDRCSQELKKEIYAKLYVLFSSKNHVDI